MKPVLKPRSSGGGTVSEKAVGIVRLEIPPGPGGAYRWAQLDDYMDQRRREFHWQAPVRLDLRARVSAAQLPGTWGFGLWNDPFSASLGIGGAGARLPSLPNAAWFFYGGQPNYLAFRDDHPVQGFLAATFSAWRIPSLLLAPGAVALPLLAFRPGARLVRRAARRLIGESAALVPGDPTSWHAYCLELTRQRAIFSVDGQPIFTSPVTPRGMLGLVLWIDNQFAAFPPSGKVRMGTSPNPEAAWLELESINIVG